MNINEFIPWSNLKTYTALSVKYASLAVFVNKKSISLLVALKTAAMHIARAVAIHKFEIGVSNHCKCKRNNLK